MMFFLFLPFSFFSASFFFLFIVFCLSIRSHARWITATYQISQIKWFFKIKKKSIRERTICLMILLWIFQNKYRKKNHMHNDAAILLLRFIRTLGWKTLVRCEREREFQFWVYRWLKNVWLVKNRILFFVVDDWIESSVLIVDMFS